MPIVLRKLIKMLGRGTAGTGFQPSLIPAGGFALRLDGEMRSCTTILGLPGPSSLPPPRFTSVNDQNEVRQASDDSLEPGFIRREAVFSCHGRHVIGHELMLNNSSELLGSFSSPMLCRMHDELLLNSILALNLHEAGGSLLVFIQITPSTLEHAAMLQLSSRNVVLAFRPEGKHPERLTARCRELKARGFRLSLDDFTYEPELSPLLELADFIRFDISPNSENDLSLKLKEIPRLDGKSLIAKNLHTPEALNIASSLAFHYFQGGHPENSRQESKPLISRHRAKVIMLLNMLKSCAEIGEIENAMKQDGALAYRVLRYINSPANGLQQEVHSISQAHAILGSDSLYRWLSLLLFCQETEPCRQDRNLQEKALLLGRLCELFGQRRLQATEKSDLFVTGLFSCLDLLLKMPLDKALGHFSLSTNMGAALLRRDGPYAPFLKLAAACVDHDQTGMEDHASRIGISIEQVNTICVKAQMWAHEIEN